MRLNIIAGKMAQLDFQWESGERRRDEIGQLIDAINNMSSQISKSVVLNSNINNTFNGDQAIQQKAAGTMDRSARDVTSELARGLAYAR